MDNFQFNDFTFEFDFQHDFTDGENRVIDDILANSVETVGLFEADTTFDGSRPRASSFFDYLYNDSGSAIDVTSLENQLVPFNGEQVHHGVESYPMQPERIVAEQNVNFDWTTFLDESPGQPNVTVEAPSSVPQESIPNEIIDAGNVICDNGFVYQELKTLDVPQMYSKLDETFGLMDLKAVDESMDYSALVNTLQSDQNDQNAVNSNATSMKQKSQQKLFFLPMQLNQTGTESLYQVATKMKNRPFILNSMLSKCTDREAKAKILISSAPKQVKTKSEQYLTVNEQLQQIQTKEIILPSIKAKPKHNKRKEALKMIKEKMPVAYAFEVVLTNIQEPSSSSTNNGQINVKKATRTKKATTKTTASKRRNNDNELSVESKPTRRSNKKIKTE